jgi:formylglycine-generating enzyme required for sulfatase activity
MRQLARIVTSLLAALCITSAASATYFVNISDLQHTPLPPNPIKIAGKVLVSVPLTSAPPNYVLISDGNSAARVVWPGGEALPQPGDFVIVEGDWTPSSGLAVTAGTAQVSHAPGEEDRYSYVPSGVYYIGAYLDDINPPEDEKPQHQVYLPRYLIGKHEITRGDYRKFLEAGGYSNPVWWSAEGWLWRVANANRAYPAFWQAEQNWASSVSTKFTQTDDFPVVGVMYYEAEAYCNWAGGSLPTEAQWEAAARQDPANNTRTLMNTHSAIFWNTFWSKYQTGPVGLNVDPQLWSGCVDMMGNAGEWCRDWYASGYYATSPSSDPQGPASGTEKVMRGGSWANRANELRTSRRFHYDPNDIYSFNWQTFGFRMVKPASREVGDYVVTYTRTEDGMWYYVLAYSTTNDLIVFGFELMWDDTEIHTFTPYSVGGWKPVTPPGSWPVWNYQAQELESPYGGTFLLETDVPPTKFVFRTFDTSTSAVVEHTGRAIAQVGQRAAIIH